MLARVRADRAAVIDPHVEKLPGTDRTVLREAVGALRRLIEEISADTAG